MMAYEPAPAILAELSHDVPAPDALFWVPEQNGHWLADYDDSSPEDMRLFRIAFETQKPGYTNHLWRFIDIVNFAVNSGFNGVRIAWSDGTSSMFPQ